MSDDHINPFDDERLSFLVLRNEKGIFSLWPGFVAIPPGWALQTGPQSRQACLDFIDAHWHDAPGHKKAPHLREDMEQPATGAKS